MCIVVIAFFATIRPFALVRVMGESMAPTLRDGDWLVIKLHALPRRTSFPCCVFRKAARLQRRDIVFIRLTGADREPILKRIIGLPGDTVELQDRQLVVNGHRVAEPYARWAAPEPEPGGRSVEWQYGYLMSNKSKRGYSPSSWTLGPIVVPPRRLFVLGDNRDSSRDSRTLGFIAIDEVAGTMTDWPARSGNRLQ
jgi:signal peptidase I